MEQNSANEKGHSLAVADEFPQTLELHHSSADALRLAGIYNRRGTVIDLKHGYHSGEDDSDPDEDDGHLQTERLYHENGQQRYYRTFVRRPCQSPYSRPDDSYDRVIEEKHFDPSGVCRVDVHFALGQPYLYRKHYHANQRLQSEKMFFVEDEETMRCRKAGHWRTYYDTGNIKSEMIYNKDGVRCGFCKRYAPDGVVVWVKDYSREQQDRIQDFNARRGKMDLTVAEAAGALGIGHEWCVHVVNRTYRSKCAPLHPDWRRTVGQKQSETWDEERRTEEFIRLSRAREVLLKYLDEHPVPCQCAR